MIENSSTPKQIDSILLDTKSFLNENPKDLTVRVGFLRLIECYGKEPEIIDALEVTKKIIIDNCNSKTGLRLFSVYLKLIQKYTIEEPIDCVLLKRIVELSFRVGNVANLVAVAEYLRKSEDYVASRDIYVKLIASKKFTQHYGIFYGYARLLLGLGEYTDSIKNFRLALSIHKGHQMAHDGLATALTNYALSEASTDNQTLATDLLQEAEMEYKSAIHWARIQGTSCGAFKNRLACLYIYQERFQDAIKKLNEAIDEEPECFYHYLKMATIHVNRNEFESAVKFIGIAYDKAPKVIEEPASTELSLLSNQCKVALG